MLTQHAPSTSYAPHTHNRTRTTAHDRTHCVREVGERGRGAGVDLLLQVEGEVGGGLVDDGAVEDDEVVLLHRAVVHLRRIARLPQPAQPHILVRQHHTCALCGECGACVCVRACAVSVRCVRRVPVSSSTSRLPACSRDSPFSAWPPGSTHTEGKMNASFLRRVTSTFVPSTHVCVCG
jgi:hypothetical protein